jgi:hypothetical protein
MLQADLAVRNQLVFPDASDSHLPQPLLLTLVNWFCPNG